MDPDYESQAEEILGAALEQPAESRREFIESCCRADPALQERVQALLHAYIKGQQVVESEPFGARIREVLAAAAAEATADCETSLIYGIIQLQNKIRRTNTIAR